MTYQLFTVEDPSKLNKEWPFKTYYINSYGFGDSAVTVYIGGVRKSNSVLQDIAKTDLGRSGELARKQLGIE